MPPVPNIGLAKSLEAGLRTERERGERGEREARGPNPQTSWQFAPGHVRVGATEKLCGCCQPFAGEGLGR